MTIEIKQLVIRAVADPGRDRSNAGARPGPSGPLAELTGFPVRSEPHPIDLDRERQAIVASCVREVLRKLERSRER